MGVGVPARTNGKEPKDDLSILVTLVFVATLAFMLVCAFTGPVRGTATAGRSTDARRPAAQAGRAPGDPHDLAVEGLHPALVLGLHQDAAQDPGLGGVGGQGGVAVRGGGRRPGAGC